MSPEIEFTYIWLLLKRNTINEKIENACWWVDEMVKNGLTPFEEDDDIGYMSRIIHRYRAI